MRGSLYSRLTWRKELVLLEEWPRVSLLTIPLLVGRGADRSLQLGMHRGALELGRLGRRRKVHYRIGAAGLDCAKRLSKNII